MKHGETSRVRIKGLQIYIWLLSIIHTWKKAVLSNDTKNKDLRTVPCTQQALNKGSYYYHWCRSNETCLVNGGQRNKYTSVMLWIYSKILWNIIYYSLLSCNIDICA